MRSDSTFPITIGEHPEKKGVMLISVAELGTGFLQDTAVTADADRVTAEGYLQPSYETRGHMPEIMKADMLGFLKRMAKSGHIMNHFHVRKLGVEDRDHIIDDTGVPFAPIGAHHDLS